MKFQITFDLLYEQVNYNEIYIQILSTITEILNRIKASDKIYAPINKKHHKVNLRMVPSSIISEQHITVWLGREKSK